MKKLLFVSVLYLLSASVVMAHGGRTNSSGCHNNNKTGGYHCHGSKLKYSSPKKAQATPAKPPVRKIVGTWHDNLGSPEMLDAVFIIYRLGDQYFITRKNGDKTEGTYTVTKKGNKFIKDYDRHGAHYLITDKGLQLHDKKGYIRTAIKMD